MKCIKRIYERKLKNGLAKGIHKYQCKEWEYNYTAEKQKHTQWRGAIVYLDIALTG